MFRFDNPEASRAASLVPAVRSACYLILRISGFAATTLLLTWGLFVLFFLALGGFSVDGLFGQLNNLTARYVDAAPERLAAFRTILAAAHLLLSAALVVLRRGRLIATTITPGDTSHG